MNKTEAITAVIRTTVDEPIIFTTGYASRIASSVADRSSHFYMTGSMGLAANIGLGIALSTHSTVVVVDGDGSLAMNPGCLLSAGAFPGAKLLHLVLDDRRYESTGGQAAPTGRTDFVGLSLAAGYGRAHRVDDVAGLTGALREGLGATSPQLLHCVLSDARIGKPPPRIVPDLPRHRERFAGHLERVAAR
ncbi:thiamine pyrophosphate-dependent enzyme [Actinoplanes sp. NPDC048796]|uniref:thiamine pyrophosphate-dependent enzyme n=1 Tax=unclassified Actinoplanes TaxID=2626549 RepID=UPI0033D6CDA6